MTGIEAGVSSSSFSECLQSPITLKVNRGMTEGSRARESQGEVRRSLESVKAAVPDIDK